MRVDLDGLIENLQIDGLVLVRQSTLDTIINWASSHPDCDDRLLDDPFASSSDVRAAFGALDVMIGKRGDGR